MISFNAAHIVKAEACEECNYYSYKLLYNILDILY